MFDTRELGRRAGTMRRVRRVVPAPAGMGTEVIGVAAGRDVELDLRFEAVMEGVLVSGSVASVASGECVRCLNPTDLRVEVDLQDLYVYPGDAHLVAEEDVREVEGDLIDLEPAVRDAVVLALPFQPVCRDDCPGLCATCGATLADDPGHHHEAVDTRWAALEALIPQAGNGADDRYDDERES